MIRIELNQWETAFFGRKIYSVIFNEQNSASSIPPLLSECEVEKGWLLQAKVPSSDFHHIAFLQQNAFQLVEGEARFSLSLAHFSPEQTPCHIQIATARNLPALKTLVAHAFPNTRFRPPYFSLEENKQFYQRWIENAVNGEFDDLCFVLKQGETLKGAISVRCREQTAKLGLLAVAPEFQRQGIGKKLLQIAIDWAQSQHAKILEITTQLSNLPAIQLYQSLGAKIVGTDYWFYRVVR